MSVRLGVDAADAAVAFTATECYGTRTTSLLEWWFVYDPEHGLDILELGQWPVEQSLVDKGLSSHCRKPLPPNKFDHERTSRNVQLSKLGHAGLLIAELLAARLSFVRFPRFERASAPHQSVLALSFP